MKVLQLLHLQRIIFTIKQAHVINLSILLSLYSLHILIWYDESISIGAPKLHFEGGGAF